ncbi:MAG: AAA family ATPase [Candidatus Marithrix sp.]
MSREQTPPARQLQLGDKFKKYVIIMEGEKHEPNYFNELRESYLFEHRESRIDVKIVKRNLEKSSHSSPEHLVQHAQDFSTKFELQEYDELWIIFDKDSWSKQAFEELKNWKQLQNYHYLAYSNPCFELWLILHLTEYETIKEKLELANPRERSNTCKQILGSSLKQKYKLSGKYNQYIRQIPLAIERARALDTHLDVEFPEYICTRIYQLAEKLTTIPKKDNFFNPDICHIEKEVESKFIVSYLLPNLGYKPGDWKQEVRGDKIRLDFLIYNLVIEAKHPNINLTDKHVEQLKRYLLGKNARYGVLTNAQELRIYEHNNKLTKLVFRCFVKNIENQVFEINQLIGKNILNPENKRIEQFNQSIQTQSEKNNMKVIGIYHNKGGVGKTTVAVNLAAAFRNMDKRVLLIDIDAQANATFATGLIKFLFDKDDDLKDSNVFSLLNDSDSGFIPEICRQSQLFNETEIDVIPSHISLIGKQSGLTTFANTRWRLNGKIQLVKEEYDIVIIDMPPSLDIYAEMALIAADYLIIPSDLKPFANQGLPNVRNFIRQTDETRISIGKEALEIIGVLPSKILSNARYLEHTFEQQKQHIIQDYSFEVLNSKILDRKVLADCFNKDIEMGELRIPDPKSIFMFDKNSESAKEFNALANEVSEKIGITQ